jgi:hypothetical protein
MQLDSYGTDNLLSKVAALLLLTAEHKHHNGKLRDSEKQFFIQTNPLLKRMGLARQRARIISRGKIAA